MQQVVQYNTSGTVWAATCLNRNYTMVGRLQPNVMKALCKTKYGLACVSFE